MTKRKGHFEGHSYFVTSLPIEYCVSQLQNLNDADIQVTIDSAGHQSVAFTAQLLERGIVRATGKGTLRRWEGTLTRVDCDVEVHEGLLTWLMFVTGFFIMLMVCLPLIIFMSANVDVAIWMSVSVGFVIVMIALIALTRHFAPLDDTPRNLLREIESALT